jgi:hypothetical protein
MAVQAEAAAVAALEVKEDLEEEEEGEVLEEELETLTELPLQASSQVVSEGLEVEVGLETHMEHRVVISKNLSAEPEMLRVMVSSARPCTARCATRSQSSTQRPSPFPGASPCRGPTALTRPAKFLNNSAKVCQGRTASKSQNR